MLLFRRLLAALACAALIASAPKPSPRPVARAMVAQPFVIAANPLAAQAGLNVLRRGGSAVDAAIAVQAMLSLVEPQSTANCRGAACSATPSAPRARDSSSARGFPG